LGEINYLAKPVRQSELLKALLAIVPSSAAREVIAASEVPLKSPATASSEPARRALRILLAEDNRVNQIFAKRLLEKQGYNLTVANNGREVLHLLSQDSFDLVLMDIQMPEMDGFEASAAIRAKETGSNKHIPIVAMTAHAMKEDRDKCIAAGMDDYVSKPIDPDALAAAIERVINGDTSHSDLPR
jgi:CheY-like chemotaxis protein